MLTKCGCRFAALELAVTCINRRFFFPSQALKAENQRLQAALEEQRRQADEQRRQADEQRRRAQKLQEALDAKLQAEREAIEFANSALGDMDTANGDD